MSTSGSIIMHDSNGDEIGNLYSHWDGDSFGEDVQAFVNTIRLTNGIIPNAQNIANGMSDLAAQVIAHFKTAPGNYYMASRNEADQADYVYHLRLVDGKAKVTRK